MQYLYDGNNIVQETKGGTINPILVGLEDDERFARNDVTGRTYFLTDSLGSIIALTDAAGEIKEQYSYDSYGNVTLSDTTTGFTNPYQYTGREADTSALYYYRARYYSPQLPGFISEDPITFGGGQLSFYAYVAGDPLDYVDPHGLESAQYSVGQTPGDYTPDNPSLASEYSTHCQRKALGNFLLNMTPFVGTAHSLYELAQGEGGAGEVFDSTGSTADQFGEAAERAAASNFAQAQALRRAGMYNARQGLLNATGQADSSLAQGFSKLGTSFAVVSWAFNIAQFNDEYSQCTCGN
jgi:RHS repeat-associated protein